MSSLRVLAAGLSLVVTVAGARVTTVRVLGAQKDDATGACVGNVTDSHARPLWATLRVMASPRDTPNRPLTPEEIEQRFKIAIGHFGGVGGGAGSTDQGSARPVNDDGRFEVRDLPAGAAFLAIDVARETKRIVRCDVRPRATTSLGQISLDVGEVLQGSVATSTGSPLADVSILLRDASARVQRVKNLAVTDPRGRFVFVDLDVGRYVLLGGHPDFGVFTQFMSTGTEPAQIAISPPGAIVATLESSNPGFSGTYDVWVSIPNTGRAVVETTSGADVHLNPVQPGSYIVSIWTSLDQVFTTSAQVVAGATTDLGVIRLARGVTLRGSVRSSSGSPVERARVVVESDVNKTRDATTNPEGQFEVHGLPSSRVRLLVKHSEYVPKQVSVDVANSADVVNVDVVLESGGAIRGRARQRDGSPIPGAQLSLIYDLGASGDDAFAFAAATDANGRFLIRGVPPGRATLTVDGTNSLLQRSIRRLMTLNIPAEGIRNLDVVLEPFVVTGVVVRRDGTPVEGAKLSIVPEGFDPMRIAPQAVSDAAGAFRADVESTGVIAIAARGDDDRQLTISPSRVTFDRGASAPIRIVVEDGVRLSGSVVRELDRTPVEGAHIVASRRPDGKTWQTLADGNGRFSMVVSPGDYDVRAEAARLHPASHRVSVTGADADVTVELPSGRQLAGRVLSEAGQPSTGSLVSVLSTDGNTRDVVATDKDGAYKFEGLPDEPLTLMASNTLGDFSVQPGLKADGADVATVLTRGAELELSVLRADGRPANGAAVHIVQVNGAAVADFSYASIDVNGRVRLLVPSGVVVVEVYHPSETKTLRLSTQPGEHAVRTLTLR